MEPSEHTLDEAFPSKVFVVNDLGLIGCVTVSLLVVLLFRLDRHFELTIAGRAWSGRSCEQSEREPARVLEDECLSLRRQKRDSERNASESLCLVDLRVSLDGRGLMNASMMLNCLHVPGWLRVVLYHNEMMSS